MYLSKLAYEVVKSSLKLGNQEFIYEAFKRGDFGGDIDYSADIDNCYTEINQAIHRLSDLRKIPYKVESFNTEGKSIIDLNFKIKEIVNVVAIDSKSGDYENIAFRTLGLNKVNLIGVGDKPRTLYVEYVEDIPNFSGEDFYYPSVEDLSVQKDVDLKQYGITDTMCSKIILYASARLFSKVDPQIANKEEALAEQYFSDLPNHGTSFEQKHISIIHSIGD